MLILLVLCTVFVKTMPQQRQRRFFEKGRKGKTLHLVGRGGYEAERSRSNTNDAIGEILSVIEGIRVLTNWSYQKMPE